ncbi:MAG: dTDP-4-dehydrorhamnose 3,5-epimerase [Candidatus Omnitrophota bacterium]
MIIEKTRLNGVLLIKHPKFEDFRGTFTEIYNYGEYREKGIEIRFVRDAISTSDQHVLRGIHYDDKTWKLIQCMYGRIYVVVVDMREGSPTYLQWLSFILTSQNRYQVLVPPHFGNGHLVLSDECIFHYKMTEYYDPANERTLRWDDPKAHIHWPIKAPVLSEKDANAPYL